MAPSTDSPDAVLDFNAALGRVVERSVAYAICYLETDRPRDDLWLQVASDDESQGLSSTVGKFTAGPWTARSWR